MLAKASPDCQLGETLCPESSWGWVALRVTQAQTSRLREAQGPPSVSHCFNSSRGENKDFMAVTNISSHTFYSPQPLRVLGSCRSWKIHKTHVNFYVQLF